MRKVSLIWLLALSSCLVAAESLAVGEPLRIGYLVSARVAEDPTPERLAFIEGLRAEGFEEGRNLVIEYRSAKGDHEALPFLADQLVERKVQVIFAIGLLAARAASAATRSIPIVMMTLSDPVSEGLVNSLANPGGNLTGIALVGRELAAKRLELLKEAVPGISRVAVIWQSREPGSATEFRQTQEAARQLKIRLESYDVAGQHDLAEPFRRIRKNRPDALLAILDQRTSSYREIIPEFALKQGLPTIFGLSAFAESGGLLSYSPDINDMFRRSGNFVARILRGNRVSAMPIEQPLRYTLVVNLKTARSLGISLPDRILQRADRIIE